MKPITATYKQWRRALIAAKRREARAGINQTRGTVHRLQLACDLRARRKWFASRQP
jgi:hypothetical protein